MENQEIAKVLNQIADFYEEDPSRWTQRAYAKDNNGNHVAFSSSKAVCWCISATIRVFAKEYNDAREIHKVIRKNLPEEEEGSISSWNDKPSQTVENVIATLRKIASEL